MLSVSFHIPDSYGRDPRDENEFVCLICKRPCLPFQILTPAYPSQIVCRIVSDSFAPRKVISYDVPLQRVLIKLRLLLRLLRLLGILGDLELLAVQFVSCHLRNFSPVHVLGLCSISVCVSVSQQVSRASNVSGA